eukprot:scaffold203607_cov18-Prasinocladus_malaysianus.AAC.1
MLTKINRLCYRNFSKQQKIVSTCDSKYILALTKTNSWAPVAAFRQTVTGHGLAWAGPRESRPT